MRATDTGNNINRRWSEITPNIENIRLVYLNNSQVNAEIKSSLMKINPAAQFYTDARLCLDLIKSITNEQLFLIISSMDFCELFHSFQTILAIFVYDTDEEPKISDDERKKYPKIIDRYSNESDLFRSIEEKIQLIEKQTLVYSLFDDKQKFSIDLTKESASFLWHQMLIPILKQIPQNPIVLEEMMNKCADYYRNNEDELEKMEFFRRNYSSEQAIQWYTKECFLSKVLNRALKTKNIEFLSSVRLFLMDLCLEIERESEKMKNHGQLILYRAQLMSNEEIEKFKNNLNGLISIDGFFSTSRDKNISLAFLQQHFPIYEPVLFEIHVDLSLETIHLADIPSTTSMSCEKEVLFSMNSLFRIESIEYDSLNHFWTIQIFASNDRRKHIDEYLKWIQKEMNYPSSIVYFGHLLWKDLGQVRQAESYFRILLKSSPDDHEDLADIYDELGNIYDQIGEYNSALNDYRHALDIREKQIPKDYIRIASLLDQMAMVYKHMGNLERAIEIYRQALDIYERKCSDQENRLHQANTIANLGLAYRDKKDFDTALHYLTVAYDIRRDILPNDHPLLANSLNNIGDIYHDKNDHSEALNYYQQALAIQEIIYSNDHVNKANTIRNIGLVYRDEGEWTNALNHFNQTLEMRQRLLSNTHHPDIAICYGDIGNIYEKMRNFDLALDYYQQQYQMEEVCLPLDHPNLSIHFEWIINLLKKKNQIDKAIEFCQMKLSDFQPMFENHPRRARILVLLAMMYEDKNPREADQSYQEALAILEHLKNEEVLSKSLSTMTNFYWKCRMFDRALICQMKLLHFRRSTLLSDHNDIAYTLRDLARTYRVMNKSSEALHHFEQSLRILQANYGSEHIDVKNIQKEISDLKDILKSISASANEDYHNRRISNSHKRFSTSSNDDFKHSSTKIITNTNRKPSTSTAKSSTCIIL